MTQGLRRTFLRNSRGDGLPAHLKTSLGLSITAGELLCAGLLVFA